MWQVAQPVTNQLKGLQSQSQRWSMFLQKFESVEAESEKMAAGEEIDFWLLVASSRIRPSSGKS